jgi:hypothetical protein
MDVDWEFLFDLYAPDDWIFSPPEELSMLLVRRFIGIVLAVVVVGKLIAILSFKYVVFTLLTFMTTGSS